MAQLVENKDLSFHEIAAIGDKSNLKPTVTGNLVHRVAELRTLKYHAGDILSGRRFVELKLESGDGSFKEIDLVTIQKKNGNHFIHDHKPINLNDIQGKPWAQEFSRWLQLEHNGKYENIGNFRSMRPELHKNFQSFLSENVKKFKNQMEDYRDIYSANFGIPKNKIKTSVLPYYVKR